jgi:hypothetical protein
MIPTDLEELYQLYSRDIDEGQLIHDLKSMFYYLLFYSLYNQISLVHSPRSTTSSGGGGGNGKLSVPTTLPFLSQIAEEDLTSASTSVTSFHLSNNPSQHQHPTSTLPPHRTLSDQDLFTRVDNDSNSSELGQNFSSTRNKPLSYSHFNFEQSLKQPLVKGNSLVSLSSDSVDVPINNNDSINGGATRRQVHTTSPPHDSASELSPLVFKNNPNNSKVKLRKQTRDIAARAAQRRANLHHRELMGGDMGKKMFTKEYICLII